MASGSNRFYRWRLFLGTAILFVLFLGECQAARPSLHFQGATYEGEAGGFVRVLVHLQIDNASRHEIEVEHGKVDLRLGHHQVGYGIVPPAYFRKHSRQSFTVPVLIEVAKLADLGWDMLWDKRIPWRIYGSVVANHAQHPVSASGTLPVAQLSHLVGGDIPGM